MDIQIRSFAYVNRQGGTALSTGTNGPAYPAPDITVRLDSGFEDWESGWHFIGAAPEHSELADFLFRNGKPTDQRLLFSEKELANPLDREAMIAFLDGQTADADAC